MAEFQVKPYESNLRSFNRPDIFSTEKKSNPQQNSRVESPTRLSGSLRVQTPQSTSSSSSVESDAPDSRERIENKTSLILFNSSTKLTNRQELNDTLIEGVKQLKTLTTKIGNEVNPLKKEELVNEAESLLSSLKAEFDTARENDSTLTSSININSLVKAGKESDEGDKFTNVNISSALSLDDAGLDSVDFTDTDNTLDQLDSALTSLSSKKSSFEGSSKQILGATSQAISEFEAENEVDTNATDQAAELSKKIVESTENILTPQENLESKTVEVLLQDKKDEVKKKDEAKEDNKETKEPNP